MKQILTIVSLIILLSCQTKKDNTTKTQTTQESGTISSSTEYLNNEDHQLSKKRDYQLADELLDSLLTNKVDTVLFYKRTCIGCCDFYNVFWAVNGKHFLHKFYFDFEDMQTHSVRIELNDDKIFAELSASYSKLQESSIKENEHKMDDGTSRISMTDHYCYSSIKIYTQNDSIISNQIKDSDFNMNSGVRDENGVYLTNDNYYDNINSKWHILLTKIEEEISSMSETSKKELEIIRVLEKETY